MNNNSHVLPSSSSRQTQLSDEMARMHIENEHEERVRVDRVLDVCRCTICLQTWASHSDRQVWHAWAPRWRFQTDASFHTFVKDVNRHKDDGALRQRPHLAP
ncbi:hypothetical protein Q3G72_027394 [Acer saccharum]|nr:hypothetical protein Q3G72_027394 [Acer saccharum]